MFLIIGLHLSSLGYLQSGFQLCLDLFYFIGSLLHGRHILFLCQSDVLCSQCARQLRVEAIAGIVGQYPSTCLLDIVKVEFCQ